jgi:hypothetical protein
MQQTHLNDITLSGTTLINASALNIQSRRRCNKYARRAHVHTPNTTKHPPVVIIPQSRNAEATTPGWAGRAKIHVKETGEKQIVEGCTCALLKTKNRPKVHHQH